MLDLRFGSRLGEEPPTAYAVEDGFDPDTLPVVERFWLWGASSSGLWNRCGSESRWIGARRIDRVSKTVSKRPIPRVCIREPENEKTPP
jgi:hypothetical protein